MCRSSAIVSAALGALVTLTSFVPSASAECTREGLLAAAQTYLTAQASGKLDGLKLASNFTYQENNKAADIAKGVLSQSLKIDLNRTTADTTACGSYTMLISSTGAKPYVIGTQIRHNGDDTSSIAMIDTIAATTGALFFDAKKTLGYIQKQDWSTVPPEKRATREQLKHAVDAYLDMWTDAKASTSVEWGAQCERVEGSSFVKPCGVSLPRGGSAKKNGMRRYIIDETLNSADALCSFDSLGPWPDSHEVRLKDGKIEYVHTITLLG